MKNLLINPMKMFNKKGFTLIELLIVITIIGILAVAFLPTILGAPAKGRDTQRIADLQKLQKILVVENLDNGTKYPDQTTGGPCVGDGTAANGTDFSIYAPALGGKVLSDPQPDNKVPNTACDGDAYKGRYFYKLNPFGATNVNGQVVKSGTYDFVFMAKVENASNANTTCTAGKDGALVPPTQAQLDTAGFNDFCYAMLQ